MEKEKIKEKNCVVFVSSETWHSLQGVRKGSGSADLDGAINKMIHHLLEINRQHQTIEFALTREQPRIEARPRRRQRFWFFRRRTV